MLSCSDCSKFWQCSPSGACLLQCPECPPGQCGDTTALSFDCRYQAPLGPVCDWPDNVDCSSSGSPCQEECCSDQDCPVTTNPHLLLSCLYQHLTNRRRELSVRGASVSSPPQSPPPPSPLQPQSVWTGGPSTAVTAISMWIRRKTGRMPESPV